MKILKAENGVLTNFEVFQILKQEDLSSQAVDTSQVIFPEEQIALERRKFCVGKILEYFENCCRRAVNLTSEALKAFLEGISQFDLDEVEVMQLVNTSPSDLCYIYGVCSKCDDRFSDEELDFLLSLVQHHLIDGKSEILSVPPEVAEQFRVREEKERERRAAEQFFFAPQSASAPLENGDRLEAGDENGVLSPTSRMADSQQEGTEDNDVPLAALADAGTTEEPEPSSLIAEATLQALQKEAHPPSPVEETAQQESANNVSSQQWARPPSPGKRKRRQAAKAEVAGGSWVDGVWTEDAPKARKRRAAASKVAGAPAVAMEETRPAMAQVSQETAESPAVPVRRKRGKVVLEDD